VQFAELMDALGPLVKLEGKHLGVA